MMLPKLLTLEETAKAINYPRSTIYLLAREGKLPGAFRFPGSRAWRVDEAKLAAWIAQQTGVQAGSEGGAE